MAVRVVRECLFRIAGLPAVGKEVAELDPARRHIPRRLRREEVRRQQLLRDVEAARVEREGLCRIAGLAFSA